MYKEYIDNLIEGKGYSFENWNEIKLISYCYPIQISFLNLIAKYIEGYVSWTFETDKETMRVEFEKGKVSFELGKMKYKTHTAKDIRPKEVAETEQEFIKLIGESN
jgi:hypothetical protein